MYFNINFYSPYRHFYMDKWIWRVSISDIYLYTEHSEKLPDNITMNFLFNLGDYTSDVLHKLNLDPSSYRF